MKLLKPDQLEQYRVIQRREKIFELQYGAPGGKQTLEDVAAQMDYAGKIQKIFAPEE